MKLKNFLLMLGFVLLLPSCAGNFKVYVNNIDVQRVSKMKPAQAIGGIIVALGVHELGHAVAIKVAGADVDFRGPFHVRFENGHLSNIERQWVSRSGYIAQDLVGMLLNYIPATKGSDFALSYNMTSFAQNLSQPIFKNSHRFNDLRQLEKYGSNEMLEWSGYTLWSGINLYNSLKKE